MSLRNFRSVLGGRFTGRSRNERLTSAAGSAPATTLESLERRQLLAFPDTTTAVALSFAGDTSNTADTIDTTSDEGWFRFTATSSDFVTVLADALTSGGSTLNTRLDLYVESETTPGFAVPAVGANGATLSATGNGTLTAGTPTDAWVGFVAEAGQTYYVRVRPEQGTTGNYTLRVDLGTSAIAVNADGSFQDPEITGNIVRRGADTVYRITTGSNAAFDSMVFVGAEADAAVLDTRLEIYDADGTLIVADSNTGVDSNAAAWFKNNPNSTFYVRVRSDEFATGRPASGAYTIRVQGAAVDIAIDPLTRQGNTGDALVGQARMYSFTAATSGRAVIIGMGTGLTPVADPAIRLFNENGTQLAFNDNSSGLNSQIAMNLVGGQKYFVLFDGFSSPPPVAGTTYNIFVSASTAVPALNGVDDHANQGDWLNATPLIFGTPYSVMSTVEEKIAAFGSGRIYQAGDTDVFVFTPPKSMMGIYDGETDPDDPSIWIEDEDTGLSFRPSTRLQLAVVPGPGFLNTNVSVWRFNPENNAFEQLYFNDTISVPDMGMSGSFDPSQADPGALAQLSSMVGSNVTGIPVWGGQPYFIVVGGNGTGEYSLFVEVDSMNEDPGDDDWYGDFEIADEGDFVGPAFLPPNNGTGDGTFLNSTLNAFPLIVASELSLYASRVFTDAAVENGFWIEEYRQTRLPVLHDINDVDIFEFTAPYTGTMEIRINTTSLANLLYTKITDLFDSEVFPDPADPPTEETEEFFSEFYNSLLDSALRIFNNDREQIAYNDDNGAVDGEFDPNVRFVGTSRPMPGGENFDIDNPFANFTFHRRDARVVFNMVEGETYYIQVENGQKYKDGSAQEEGDRVPANPWEINWRAVAGTYQLLLNGVGNPQNDPEWFSSPADDHPDSLGTSSDGVHVNVPVYNSVIAMDPVTGTGSIQGVIETTGDADLFVFRATSTGTVTVNVGRVGGPTNIVVPRVELYNENGELIGEGRATSAGVVEFTAPVINGRLYDVRVYQDSITTGAYELTISNLAEVDDHADVLDFGDATPLPLEDFLGGGSITGRIEMTGDTDVFRFEAFTNQDFTFVVTSHSATLDPTIEIYEVAEDPEANPYLRRIGFNDNGPVAPHSRLTLGVNFPRVSDLSNETYNTYYVVIRGRDPRGDFGDYTLDVTFAASDDHADAGQFGLATEIVVNATSGDGTGSGSIELEGDSDLFMFTAPASGDATVNVTVPDSGTLLQRVRIYDKDFNLVASNQNLNPTDVDFAAVRGQVYYVLVDASPTANTTQRTGTYTIDVHAPAIDDHANIGEFELATPVSLAAATGDGRVGGTAVGAPSNPTIGPVGDTDLFTFVTLAAGDVTVTVTPFSSTVAGIGPRVRVYDSSGALVSGLDVSATTGLETVTLDIPATAAGQRFYILISAINPADFTTTATGEYGFTLDGPPGVAPPPPDPSELDFENPQVVTLDGRADATINSSISVATERDLYTFIAPASGNIYVQLITPSGSVLALSLTVLSAPNEDPSSIIAFDAGGLPGVASNVLIPRGAVTAGQQFWVVVDGIGAGTGGYTLRIDAAPETYVLYYPEGFTNNRIREVVSFSNGGTTDVSYTVKLYYNDGVETIVKTGTVGAGSRGGAIISNGALGPATGVRAGVPYSIVIESSGPLGATLAHYDFDQSTGDSFTDAPSSTWTFARVERNPGNVADALTLFNPNSFDVVVTLTAHTASGTVVLTNTIGANRRGGWNIAATNALPVGVFGVTLTSAPADSANQAAFIGIVAGLTHYDIERDGGYGIIGQPDLGARAGAVPSLSRGATVESEISLYNPGALPTTVTIVGKYVNANLPDLVRVIQLPAFGTALLTSEELGLVADQPIGLSYTSTFGIVVLAAEFQRGEADAAPAITEVGTRFFFGDAFINKNSAGINYFETLALYNPAAVETDVTIRLLFTDGTSAQFTVEVDARGFAQVNLHERPEILNRTTVQNYFSIDVSSATQIGVQLTHYDLFLDGGYAQRGAPLGLLTPLSRIS